MNGTTITDEAMFDLKCMAEIFLCRAGYKPRVQEAREAIVDGCLPPKKDIKWSKNCTINTKMSLEVHFT